MTDMEMDVAADIMLWAMEKFNAEHDISHEFMVYAYWQEIFDNCDMGTKHHGMEVYT